MDEQAAPASVLQLSIFATAKSIPRPERYADLPVTVRLVAPGREQTVRASIDIVAAIDRGVDAYRLDQEKSAVKLVVKEKLLPGDRLAIVPFDDDVAKDEEELVVMSADGKEKTLSTLNSLETGNGTRLSKPLERAEKILMGRSEVDRPAFIILLSDGGDTTILAEKEWTPTSASVLAEPAYPVHTFGFPGSHNAETMSYIATRTKGIYTDVEPIGWAADNISTTVAGLVGKARSGMFSAVGVGADFAAMHPGVSLLRIDSGDRKASIGGDARSGVVDVGTMSAGEMLEFTVYLDVPEGDVDVEAMEVLSVGGSYTQGWDGVRVKLGPSVVSVDRPVPPQPEPQPEPEPMPKPVLPDCSCREQLDLIEERLKYWCKVKVDLAAMYEKMEAEAIGSGGGDCKCQCQVSAVLRESSLESVNRAMYQDIYTAVVHAIKLRECSTGTAAEHGCDGDKAAVEAA